MTANCPKFFYKYRAATTDKDLYRIQRMVEHGEIYFGSSFEFNDPFDCRPALNFDCTDEEFVGRGMQYLLAKHGTKLDAVCTEAGIRADIGTIRDPRFPERRIELQKQMAERLGRWGVFCGAERADSVLMWSHYANSFSGVCVEIDSSEFEHVEKVNYVIERPVVDGLPFGEPVSMAVTKALFTKSKEWEYEDEWRAIGNKGVATLSEHGIIRVIFGHNCSAERRDKIISYIASSKKNIQLAEISPDDSRFGFNIKTL